MCRQVVVQWTTRDAGSPVAQVGTTSGQYSQTAIGVSNTYTRSLMVGEPANTVGYFDPVSRLPTYMLCLISTVLPAGYGREAYHGHRNLVTGKALRGTWKAPQQACASPHFAAFFRSLHFCVAASTA